MQIRMSSNLVAPGTYSARYTGTSLTQVKGTKHLFLNFEILKGQSKGRRAKALIGSTDDEHFSFTPGSRAHKLVEGLQGGPASLDEDIDLESTTGALYRIEIENKKKAYKVFANVIKVLSA